MLPIYQFWVGWTAMESQLIPYFPASTSVINLHSVNIRNWNTQHDWICRYVNDMLFKGIWRYANCWNWLNNIKNETFLEIPDSKPCRGFHDRHVPENLAGTRIGKFEVLLCFGVMQKFNLGPCRGGWRRHLGSRRDTL